jgi:hypothetical protein
MIVFVNAHKSKPFEFSFNFNGSKYGLNGALSLQKLTPTEDGDNETMGNSFNKNVTLEPLDTVAFIIK